MSASREDKEEETNSFEGFAYRRGNFVFWITGIIAFALTFLAMLKYFHMFE